MWHWRQGPGAREFVSPASLDVSPRGDLWIADPGAERIQIFARKGLALRRVIERPGALAARSWEPRAIAFGRRGRVFVADPRNRAIHLLDRWGNYVRSITRGAAGSPLGEVLHVAVDCDGLLYAAERANAAVSYFSHEGKYEGALSRADQAPGVFPVALMSDSSGRIYLSCAAPGGVSCHCYPAPRQTPRSCRTPLTARVAAFDSTGALLALDGARLLRTEAEAFAGEGAFLSQPLDSRIRGCRWSRLILAGELPSGCSIRLETYTSETERSAEEIESLPQRQWSAGPSWNNPSLREIDVVTMAPPGRYLWLRATLVSDGSATPRLREIRVEFPRRTSLERLPAVFRQGPEGGEFLERFLAMCDRARSEVTARLDDFPAALDPRSTSSDFLPWLASWIGLVLDRHWPEAQRRRLLANAHELYTLRGKPEGLLRHVELYTGARPRILEHYKLRRWAFLCGSALSNNAELFGLDVVDRLQAGVHSTIGEFRLLDNGDPRTDPANVYAHRFTVFVAMRREPTTLQRVALDRIVALAKPAHTEGFVEIAAPRMRIGGQARVGLNTIVGEYPAGVTLADADNTGSKLGKASVLTGDADDGPPPTMRVGSQSRIGGTTRID